MPPARKASSSHRRCSRRFAPWCKVYKSARHSGATSRPPKLSPASCPRAHQSRSNAMPSFEDSLKRLETIVDQLEKGDLSLEDSIKLFEEGVGLSAACKKELDTAEGKVQILIKQRDGSMKTEPFPTDKTSK